MNNSNTNTENNLFDKRTKGVWGTEVIEREGEIHIFSNTENCAIATCYSEPLDDETRANAAFICKAVNNYVEMLDELKRLYEKHGGQQTMDVIKQAEKQ